MKKYLSIIEYISQKGPYIIFFISILVFSFSVFQYVLVSRINVVNAYTTKSINGHSWTDMECSSTLCVGGEKTGIGTDNPSVKLEVDGTLKATDACTNSGICLSNITDFLR